jgi:hypothetical protein
MSDNLVLNAGSGGATLRTLAEAGGIGWSACVAAYATTVSPGANVMQVVTASAGLPVAQQGTWSVTVNGTTAVSAASLPLPTGAATAAKQPALGTAGTASADVLTVQGIASMTALKVDGSGVTQPVSGTFWQATQPVSGTFWQATQPVSGTFWQATQPVSGTVSITANSAVNVAQLAGTATDTNSGTKSAGTLRVVIATDQPQLTNKLLVTPDANSAVNVAQLAGTAADTNSGNKSAGTLRVVLATDQPQLTNSLIVSQATAANLNCTAILAAGTALVGQVSASQETATLYNGTTALTPKFAVITASSSGGNTVVSAVGGKKIRVLKWSLSFSGTVNIKWQSHTTPTDITGLHYGVANATAGGAYCPLGHFQTVTGEALDINLSGAVAVGGELTYVEV